MTGEPGPCILQIPANVYWDRVDQVSHHDRGEAEDHVPEEQMAEVIRRIRSAKRVGMIAGLGAADAASQVCELAEWLHAPLITTGSGRGVLDEAHPLSLAFGWKSESFDAVNRVLAVCDLILAIGVKFSQTGTQDFRLDLKTPLIHVDASPEVPDANYEAETSLTMDAREFLDRVLEKKKVLGSAPRRRIDFADRRRTGAVRDPPEKRYGHTILHRGKSIFTRGVFRQAARLLPARCDPGHRRRV